ncbi:hypothetical protein KP509_29G048300 [Ceratopteris richardii]|uniref:Uncharacterized protein n=1 Tax=Ceratopteris richardii TaxID=49495 RepID=A0A8T2R8F0_CERRI|nr:hypothetical protein KP509_29G048300 [Ceratopteris richardii]
MAFNSNCRVLHNALFYMVDNQHVLQDLNFSNIIFNFCALIIFLLIKILESSCSSFLACGERSFWRAPFDDCLHDFSGASQCGHLFLPLQTSLVKMESLCTYTGNLLYVHLRQNMINSTPYVRSSLSVP